MNTESFPYQKRVRAMGTALAVISALGLLSWLVIGLTQLFFPPALGFEDKEGLTYFERFVGDDAPDPKVATAEELRNHFETHFAKAQPDLPDGVTKEIYVNTMVYFTKMRAGEVVAGFMIPEADDLVDPETGDVLDFDFDLLPGGMTEETTIRELMLKDRAFFEAHLGTYRLLVIVTTAFFSILSLVILRMALSWRKGDPFGPGTIRGLRWLGVLFLAQFLASWAVGLFVPYDSGFITDLTVFSGMFEDLAASFGIGASLSSGIVFLTLSWVLDYGRRMKEEQALTI